MTPAINLADKLKLSYRIHEFDHDASAASFGLEAAAKMKVDGAQIFKTLVVQTDSKALAVAIIPVTTTLNFKKMAKALGCKKVQLAEPNLVLKSTGYVLGGVSPLGQKKRLPTVIDDSATNFATIFVSAGRRGLEIELSPNDLATALTAKFADIGEKS
ncbi:Cys-tRNA(Pro) deacylase [Psychrobacter ciconiae]|uniref:Cys-tRNA(Pro) deacylase n=1 Tax=Psychrobacter ciconiae TaxID=1553449 RepID=UPI00191901D2|nr:Cys-tRNA(Pro) deacylase [Psychrobacter ciconiae]